MRQRLQERLAARPLLLDGGVGTLLQSLGAPVDTPLELLNLTDPARVQEVHKRYIQAGAEVITTHTFAASARALGPYGAEGKVREINRRAVRLAREVRELQGVHVLVAGSVGPLGEYLASTGLGRLTEEEALAMFAEQISALVEGGADLLTLETFGDLNEALLALRAARSVCDLPVLVQLAFDDDGRTALGQSAAEAVRALRAAGADAVGANCSTGPRGVLRAVQAMRRADPEAVLIARPNAGLPHRVQNRLFYATTPEYAARYARDAVDAGVTLIGGCCGMGPAHIAAMRAALDELAARQEAAAPGPSRIAVLAQPASGGPGSQPSPQGTSRVGGEAGFTSASPPGPRPSALAAKLAAGEFVVSVEMHPPRTHLTGAFLRAARAYKEAGIKFVNVVDSPMARVRMSSLMACGLLQQWVGLETIAHLTPRDRTLMGLQADLIGAHAMGVRAILCVTGDPHQSYITPGTVNVYDVDSIGMIRMLAGYNRGVDLRGNDIGRPTRFLIGGALNPNAPDLGLEVERFHQKVEAGMHFAMVQPVFDVRILTEMLDRLGRPSIPIIAGICPIHSYQHALLLHNEIPGIVLTDEVLERMRRAESRAEEEGIAIAREQLAAVRDVCQGVYIMPSYGRYEMALRVLEGQQL